MACVRTRSSLSVLARFRCADPAALRIHDDRPAVVLARRFGRAVARESTIHAARQSGFAVWVHCGKYVSALEAFVDDRSQAFKRMLQIGKQPGHTIPVGGTRHLLER